MLKLVSFPLTIAAASAALTIQPSAGLASAGIAHPVDDDETSEAEESTPGDTGNAQAGPYVVERNEQGDVTKVQIGDRVVDVCTAERQDSCINPRDAGLDQGRREIDYWPGKPASEIEEPLPLEKPAAEPAEELAAEQPSAEAEQG